MISEKIKDYLEKIDNESEENLRNQKINELKMGSEIEKLVPKDSRTEEDWAEIDAFNFYESSEDKKSKWKTHYGPGCNEGENNDIPNKARYN